MKQVSRRISAHIVGNWWSPEGVPANLESLFGHVLAATDVSTLQKLIRGLEFKSGDAVNGLVRGSRAQKKLLLALRLLAHVVAPELDSQSMSVTWTETLFNAFEKERVRIAKGGSALGLNLEKLEIPPPPADNPPDPVLVPEVASGVVSEIPSEPRSEAPSAQSRPEPKSDAFPVTGLLPRNIVVRITAEAPLRVALQATEDFADFVRNLAMFSLPTDAVGRTRELVYALRNRKERIRFHFNVDRDPDSPKLRVEVTHIEEITEDDEGDFYARVAEARGVKGRLYTVPEGQVIKIGLLQKTQVFVSGKVRMKLQIKHRLAKTDVAGILAELRSARPGFGGVYRARVPYRSLLYEVILDVSGVDIAIKSIYLEGGH